MESAKIIARLKALEPGLRGQGVTALYLYGSHARGDARPDSDVDILVEFDPDFPRDLVSYLRPYFSIEEELPGIEIGYGTRENIENAYRPTIENAAIRIF
ncbi:MAG: nucleotidyltransferase domain-containing protein [Phyllobacteriaceae bacterium]|nr:nucleotidyltransferase domain-containing protein [Phyllobacteriaceae bacterium]